MDVEKILDINNSRRKWADEATVCEIEEKKRQEAALKKAVLTKKRKQAAIRAHWASGCLSGTFSVFCGFCASHENPILAVSCALFAAAFALGGTMVEQWL